MPKPNDMYAVLPPMLTAVNSIKTPLLQCDLPWLNVWLFWVPLLSTPKHIRCDIKTESKLVCQQNLTPITLITPIASNSIFSWIFSFCHIDSWDQRNKYHWLTYIETTLMKTISHYKTPFRWNTLFPGAKNNYVWSWVAMPILSRRLLMVHWYQFLW